MTRSEYIEEFKNTYKLIHVMADKKDYTVFRFRHKKLNKDIVLRSYTANISAYKELMNIECENLPEIYDVITLDDGIVVLEEYIDSITLAEDMEVTKYGYKKAVKVLRALCTALEVMHGKGLIHRDVKPENILITKDERIVLIDFNAFRKISNASKDTVIMGTVGYASPEQLGISQSDERTDVYAMGVLLNFMLTGKHPSEEMAVGKGGRIVRKCTDISPKKRYQSVSKLCKAL